jgi:hypothetical protein
MYEALFENAYTNARLGENGFYVSLLSPPCQSMKISKNTNFNEDQLRKSGFVQLPNGAWTHSSNLPKAEAHPARLPDPKPQHPARETLVSPPRRKAKGSHRFEVRIERHASRLLDADNFAGGCKPLIDQLRYHGLISDDDPASLEVTYSQHRSKETGIKGMVVEIVKLTNPQS